MNEAKPVDHINKNLQSFLQISSIQKDVTHLPKLQEHAFV